MTVKCRGVYALYCIEFCTEEKHMAQIKIFSCVWVFGGDGQPVAVELSTPLVVNDKREVRLVFQN